MTAGRKVEASGVERRNYLWVAEAWGVVGSVAHRRHPHSLRTNSQLSVTCSAAQALSATFIIQAATFPGTEPGCHLGPAPRFDFLLEEKGAGPHPIELRARQAAATGDLGA